MSVFPETPAPPTAARFSVVETLRDGRAVQIRAQRPTDVEGLKAAVAHTSAESLSRRFFAPKRHFSEQEIAYFLNIDFVTQVALVAVIDAGSERSIVAGGRYILVQPGVAEVAFAVVDDFQGQGIGTKLMRHLASIAREASLRELIAEVLPENQPMLSVFQKCGLPVTTRRDRGAIHVTMQLA
ncbi:MAG: GNAT family N-acetyltransferase [Xanthobacteraceae bacterium]